MNSTYVVNPVEVRMKESSNGSIYKSIVVMGIRSRQVNDKIKTQLTQRMIHIVDDIDDIETTNLDKLAISKEFDRLPKPTFIAMKEIFTDRLDIKSIEK